jgi:hypothetical protein
MPNLFPDTERNVKARNFLFHLPNFTTTTTMHFELFFENQVGFDKL